MKVGGSRFEATASTLLKEDSMLSRMVASEIPTSKDEDGCIKIDRPGRHFNEILDYLRSGMFPTFDNIKDAEELRNEADYYSVGELKRKCENRIDELEKDRMHHEHASTIDKNKTLLVRRLLLRSEKNRYGDITWSVQGSEIDGLDGFRIPRMMDGSISLSMLRRAYPSATGLCIHTSGHEFTMLPVLGDLIQIPEEDESKRYYVLPYQSKD